MTALDAPATFDSVDPATGRTVGTFPEHDAAAVAAAVQQARAAARWWDELGEPDRRRRLRAWRADLVARTDELAALIHAENGKPVDDAVLEVTITVAHLSWAAGHARSVLGPRRVRPGLLAANHRARLDYRPYGVVGVIGPWNYPLHTPMGSIGYALAAGNAVVFKPSEFTPAVGRWLADSLARVVPEQPVLQVVTGGPATGAALAAAGVDKLAFTGSARTGRAVMAACARTLTPCVIEGGGKDALIVAADADVALAAEQAVWGGLFNGGQTCAGVERVYVDAAVYEEFVRRVAAAADGVRRPDAPDAEYGPITMPQQVAVIAGHIDDALERGATALVGGRDSVRGGFVDPVVLTDVPDDAPAVTDETFGPVLVIRRVRDTDEAVTLANSGRYGLGASVFSRGHGWAIADRLTAGMVSINSVLTYASVPGLPWGGSGDSGFGRIHGPDGLHEFARSRAVTDRRFAPPLAVTTFTRRPAAVHRLQRLARLRWGRGAGAL